MHVRAGAPWIRTLATAAAAVLALAARAEARLDLAEGSGHALVAGALERDGVRVEFESRETATGAEARIRAGTGEAMTEVVVDEVLGTLVYRVDGVEITPRGEGPDRAGRRRAFDRPEAGLAATELWRCLVERGFDPSTKAMAALAANLVGYEGIAGSPLAGGDLSCLGCCGPGCVGCTGCYTQACLAHDLCVAAYGLLDSRCNAIVYFAALSAWCCRGVDLGNLC